MITSRNPLQMNQYGCDKEISRLQAQGENLERQQSNNQNYTNQHSHSKNTALDPRSGGQTQNVEILAATAGTKKTMKILRNIGEQFKNQVNINATHHKMQ